MVTEQFDPTKMYTTAAEPWTKPGVNVYAEMIKAIVEISNKFRWQVGQHTVTGEYYVVDFSRHVAIRLSKYRCQSLQCAEEVRDALNRIYAIHPIDLSSSST